MERKTIPAVATKIDQDQGIVEHLISVFGVLDEGGDIVHPGSFVKTISERTQKIRVLDQHNTHSINSVLGKPLSLREVGAGELPAEVRAEYPEATGGLVAQTQYFLDTPEGKGAFSRIKNGGVNEYSFAFDPLDLDYTKQKDKLGNDVTVRNLRTLKLYEYSPVIWGMNPATATIDVKAAENEKEEEKQVNFSEIVEEVSRAFSDQFSTPNYYAYVRDVFDDYVIACINDAPEYDYWSVPYTRGEDGSIMFAGRTEWLGGDYTFIPGVKAGVESVAKKAHKVFVKEMTDEGPVRRLGDVLQGSIHRTFTAIADDLYMAGKLSRDERINLSSLIGEALGIVNDGMGEDLAQREYDEGAMWLMSAAMRGDVKAGRVLAARNATRIQEAMRLLNEAIEDAGLLEDEEDTAAAPEKAAKAQENEEDLSAGPGKATHQGHLIEIERVRTEIIME